MHQAQWVRNLLRGVPKMQAQLRLPRELPVDGETTRLWAARKPACRQLREDRRVTAATTVRGELPRDPAWAPTRRDSLRELLMLL